MEQQLIFALGVTGPIMVILFLGLVFRLIGLINEQFVLVGNKIVFNVTLPCMLFLSIATRPLGETLDLSLVLFGAVCTLLVVFGLSFSSPLFVKGEKRGVFIQGSFRGNMGIVGLALVLNAYGPEMLSKAGIYLSVLVVLYNLLSIWVLHSRHHSYIGSIVKNPLIIAVVLGVAWSGFDIELPLFVEKTGRYFSQMTLPLALLCIGGSLRWESFKTNHQDVLWATLFKLLFIPLLTTAAAIVWGFRGADLGLFFLMMSAPTAAASYVMAREMTQHGDMAAEIVAMTTAMSPLTVTVGLVILKNYSFI